MSTATFIFERTGPRPLSRRKRFACAESHHCRIKATFRPNSPQNRRRGQPNGFTSAGQGSSGRQASGAAVSVGGLVFASGLFANTLDGDDLLILGGAEYDDALGAASGHTNALHRAANKLPAVGH